jgi:LmbE family N-acetylglucosaminyl deacetylase
MSTDESGRRALILVAHCDDETLGAGGLIRRLKSEGWAVDVVILSDGKLTVRGEVQDNSADAAEACRALGTGPPTLLGFPDQRFDTYAVADLANAVMQLDLAPDLIVTHVDTDLNQDHRLVCEVAKIVGRPKRKPASILGCEIPNTSFWNGRVFRANFYVDISQEIDAKIDAFACYRNELQPYPHPWSREGLKLLAQYHGMQAGCGYAEAFHVIRAVAGRLP